MKLLVLISLNIFSQISSAIECTPAQLSELSYGKSVASLSTLFSDLVCSNKGQVIPHEKLDLTLCTALIACENKNANVSNIDRNDEDFLIVEVTNYLIKKYTDDEMKNYQSIESKNLAKLIEYVNNMPKDLKKDIKLCPIINNTDSKTCGKSNAVESIIAKHYLNTNFDNHFRATLLESIGDEKGVLEKAMLYSGEMGPPGFEDIIESERSFFKYQTRTKVNFEKSEKNLVDMINTSFLNESKSKSLSSRKLKEIVANALINQRDFSNSDFAFDAIESKKMILKSVENIQFNESDFDVNNKKTLDALKNKLNKIRVNVINESMKNNCEKSNYSVDKVCKKIDEKISRWDTLNVFEDEKVSPTNELGKLYAGRTDAISKEKLNRLNKMNNAPGDVFNKYVSFKTMTSICSEKYKKLNVSNAFGIKESAASVELVSELKKDREDSARVVLNNIHKVENQNESFKKAMTNARKSEVAKTQTKNTNDENETDAKAKIDESKKVIPVPEEKVQLPVNKKEKLPVDNGLTKIPVDNSMVFSPRKDKEIEELNLENKLLSKQAEFELREKEFELNKAIKAKQDLENAKDKDSKLRYKDLEDQIASLKKSKDESLEKIPDTKASDRPVEKTIIKSANNFSDAKIKTEVQDKEPIKSAERSIESVSPLQDTTTIGSPIVKNSNLVTGNSTNGNTVAKPQVKDLVSVGITLSKSGELIQDTSKILENPKEGEIINILNETDGRPFIIKENGVLVKVSFVFDTKGQKLIKKEPLSKKDSLKIEQKKKVNLIKEFKEVDDLIRVDQYEKMKKTILLKK